MRRTALGLLALVLVTGCGTDSAPSYTLNPSTPTSDGGWSSIREQLRSLDAGSYQATLMSQRCAARSGAACRLTVQTVTNDGVFSLSPPSLSSEVRVERSGAADSVIEMRELSDGSLYTFNPSGQNRCWIRWEREYAATFEIAFRSGLEVLRSTEVAYELPRSGRASEVPARANALAVVRTLGLPTSLDTTYGITESIRTNLAARTVTITLKVDDAGARVSFAADGRQVAAELAPGARGAAYLETVRDSRSTFLVTDFDEAPSVAAPSPDAVVDRTAPPGSTCSAAG